MPLKRYSEFTSLDKSGRENKLFHSLNCAEQAVYFEAKRLRLDKWAFFVNSIIPDYGYDVIGRAYAEVTDLHGMPRPYYFIMLDNTENIDKIIRDSIKNNHSVVFKTRFDKVYPYCWYNEELEDEHLGHFSTIVDVDNRYYYVADSLTVFEPARTIIAKDNPAIVKIPISQMQCGLNQHCELFNIGIKKWSPGYLDKSISYIKREYDSKYLCNENINERYYGRTALYKLLEGIEGTDWSGLNSTTFSSHFQFHLVASRHRILLEAIKRQGGCNEKLCECLHNNLKLWERVAALVFKNNLYGVTDLRKKVYSLFTLIVDGEDTFFRLL